MENIRAIKGTYDILPGDVEIWQKIESIVRDTMELYGYSEVRTPIFEETGLFARSIGEDTDIVGKEMYSFRDMGERNLTLRPEGTASVVRSFIEHRLDQRGLPQKLWYMGPMFRQERPQKGRQRQFHQFGVEVIGSASPMVDAEVMHLFDIIADKLGLKDRIFDMNCLGGAVSRNAYKTALGKFLDTVEDSLCDDCRRRKASNPLRVLDCKVPGCHEMLVNSPTLPKTIDNLTPEDEKKFKNILECLDNIGIKHKIDFSLVRGLDYYTGTVFEMKYEGLGAQSTIVGGGRYDNLIAELGGPDLPAAGFACGIERLIIALKSAHEGVKVNKTLDVYLIAPETDSQNTAMNYCAVIRQSGYSTDMDYLNRSVKAQMKIASKYNAKYVVIVEPEENTVSVRNMEKSEQKSMTFNEFLALLKKKSE